MMRSPGCWPQARRWVKRRSLQSAWGCTDGGPAPLTCTPTPATTLQPRLSELPAIAKTLDNREEAIKGGLTVQGIRYEVCAGAARQETGGADCCAVQELAQRQCVPLRRKRARWVRLTPKPMGAA